MLGREGADRATKYEGSPGTEINKTKDFSESLAELLRAECARAGPHTHIGKKRKPMN